MTSPTVQKLLKKGLTMRLNGDSPSALAIFLLEEQSKNESQWHSYINTLPKDVSNFPSFFTDEEKKWLEGSNYIDVIKGLDRFYSL